MRVGPSGLAVGRVAGPAVSWLPVRSLAVAWLAIAGLAVARRLPVGRIGARLAGLRRLAWRRPVGRIRAWLDWGLPLAWVAGLAGRRHWHSPVGRITRLARLARAGLARRTVLGPARPVPSGFVGHFSPRRADASPVSEMYATGWRPYLHVCGRGAAAALR